MQIQDKVKKIKKGCCNQNKNNKKPKKSTRLSLRKFPDIYEKKGCEFQFIWCLTGKKYIFEVNNPNEENSYSKN